MSETSSSSSSLSPETRQEIVTLIHEAFQSLNSMPAPPLAAPSQPPYTPPLTRNTAAGASSSLLSLFPEVEAASITAIITHNFRASDLYKLDSRYRDKTERQILSLKGETLELTTNDSAYRDYKSLNAIAIPLSTYFSILVSHAETSGKIASEYEWSAVIAYHMAFFNKRRREMQEGDYSGWGKVDMELRSGHRLCPPPSQTHAGSLTKGPACPTHVHLDAPIYAANARSLITELINALTRD
ncbi:hypothetical protein GGU10DRAFT_337764 [Lentinula aff. detonsa]|uniref:Uncharacterized protein n=1 Tax=Lentinula aff. detonsa TaxID=2804958 RepID=A0AA38NH62_9AGAR|nr:hypothetical protein GGU10DRAFT_337764 [Lentinula aff. detonsa]